MAQPPAFDIDTDKIYRVTITTDRGQIVADLDPQLAPNSVNHFVQLTRAGFLKATRGRNGGHVLDVWMMAAAVGLLVGPSLYVYLGARAERLRLSQQPKTGTMNPD